MPAPNTPVASSIYVWCREDGESVILGEARPFSGKPAGAVVHVTEDRATAKLWAKELAAGRKPSLNEAPLWQPHRSFEDRLSRNP